jgi:O-antigen/teichoic acid export membrane protein
MDLSIRTLTRQTSIYGLFQILQRGVGFAVIPFYTHFLNPEQFGSLDILYLIVWFVGIVGGSKLDAAFIRYHANAQSSNTLGSLLSSSLIGLASFATVFCGAAALSARPILRLMFATQDIPISGFYLALSATWLELVASLPLAYLRINHRARIVGTLGLARSIVAAAVGLFCVSVLHLGVEGILTGAVIGGVATAGTGYLLMLRNERITFDTRYTWPLYRYALPMLPAPLFMYLLNYADRFLLVKYSSLAVVGIYGMAYKFAMLANLAVMGPFGEMWGANQFNLYQAERKETYRKIALLYVSVLYLAALCITYFSYDITLVAFEKSYHGLMELVAPLTVGVAIWGIVPTLDFGCLVRNKTWLRSLTTGIAALINIVLNFVLIRRFGAAGAALATLLSFIALTTITYALNRLLTDYCVDVRKAAVMSAGLMLFACLSYASPYVPYGMFLSLRILALTLFAWLTLRMNGIGLRDVLQYFHRQSVAHG